MISQRPTLFRLLLGLAAIGILAGVVCGIGWIYTLHFKPWRLNDLTLEQRQALVQEFFDVSSAGRAQAWFEPGIGFTLRRGVQVSVWGDQFVPNELGYRAGPCAKEDNTFRVLFVGDSWTYGMGVQEAESFPRQFEAMANEQAPIPERIEAWPLALPGYNSFNELRALEVFFDRIEPDAVILCPTANDNDTGLAVLPDGSTVRPRGILRDHFGDDHSLMYRTRNLNSFKYLSRWGRCFDAIRETEKWLEDRKVPFVLFFLADWNEAFVHRLVTEAGLSSPYLIAPQILCSPEWTGTSRWKHGNAACYGVLASLAYSAMAKIQGWPAGPSLRDDLHAPLHHPPVPGNWLERSDRFLRSVTRKNIPADFAIPLKQDHQCAGVVDPKTGLMGRNATVLVRRQEGFHRRLAITVRRIAERTALYPLELRVVIPSAGGGTETTALVPADGPERHRFLVDIPDDIPVDTAMDVEFRASRVTLSPQVLSIRSLYIEEITPQG